MNKEVMNMASGGMKEDMSVVLTVLGGTYSKYDGPGYGYSEDRPNLGTLDRIPYWLGKKSKLAYRLYDLFVVPAEYPFDELGNPYQLVSLRSATVGDTEDGPFDLKFTRLDTGETSEVFALSYRESWAGFSAVTHYDDAATMPLRSSDVDKQITLTFTPPPQTGSCSITKYYLQKGGSINGQESNIDDALGGKGGGSTLNYNCGVQRPIFCTLRGISLFKCKRRHDAFSLFSGRCISSRVQNRRGTPAGKHPSDESFFGRPRCTCTREQKRHVDHYCLEHYSRLEHLRRHIRCNNEFKRECIYNSQRSFSRLGKPFFF